MNVVSGPFADPPPPAEEKPTRAFQGPEARKAVAGTINGALGLLGLYIITGAIIIGVFFVTLFACLSGLIAILAAIVGVFDWLGAATVLGAVIVVVALIVGVSWVVGAKWVSG